MLEALGADLAFHEDIVGDLAEEYALRVEWDGRVAARRWYYRESVRVAPYLLRDWLRGLGWRDVASLITVILWSSLSVATLESLLQAASHASDFVTVRAAADETLDEEQEARRGALVARSTGP